MSAAARVAASLATYMTGKRVLVTGGTGSFGRRFVAQLLQDFPGLDELVVYSRDELKQFEMAQQFPTDAFPQLRFVIGDVRDLDRLTRSCERTDIIIHAAALKHVHIAEANPMECIKTNVLGADNVIRAAELTRVSRVVALSTDKAASPVSLYGASKLCADKLFTAATPRHTDRDLRFSVVRYGNVIGSRGSVVPFFLQQRKNGFLPITHKDMTRFTISFEKEVELVYTALRDAWGGEIFVPKIPSYRLLDVARAIGPELEIRYVGLRPGEKLHEEMITSTDSFKTVEFDAYYAILPSVPGFNEEGYLEVFGGARVAQGFSYNSESNPDFLTVEDIRTEIREHVDPDFEVVGA